MPNEIYVSPRLTVEPQPTHTTIWYGHQGRGTPFRALRVEPDDLPKLIEALLKAQRACAAPEQGTSRITRHGPSALEEEVVVAGLPANDAILRLHVLANGFTAQGYVVSWLNLREFEVCQKDNRDTVYWYKRSDE